MLQCSIGNGATFGVTLGAPRSARKAARLGCTLPLSSVARLSRTAGVPSQFVRAGEQRGEGTQQRNETSEEHDRSAIAGEQEPAQHSLSGIEPNEMTPFFEQRLPQFPAA